MAKNNEDKNSNIGYKITFFILLLLVIGAMSGCIFSPKFNITNVGVSNNINVSTGEILSTADVPLGVNIFNISDRKIISQVEALPYIKSAKLYRKFPSTVILKVEEREPYAIVKYLESFAIADKYGYILDIENENTYQDLPIIYGIDVDNISSGDKLKGTASTKYENCMYLLENANKIDFKYKFSEINYDDPTNVKLYISQIDLDVVYGNVDISNVEEKISHLSSIIEKLNGKKGNLDMSNEDYLARTVFTEK